MIKQLTRSKIIDMTRSRVRKRGAGRQDWRKIEANVRSYIDRLSFHPTTLGLDRKHHQGTTWWYFARYNDIFKAIHQEIDGLQMLMGYQLPKFMQFDGKRNSKQHIAHFAETCNNSKTEGDHLVMQFVCFLKGNAFNRYTDLESKALNS